MSRDNDDTRRAIIATLKAEGPAGRSDIQAALGEAWSGEARAIKLRNIMGQMYRNHVLVRTRYGVYDLSPNYQMRGVSEFGRLEDNITEFLRERGGVAKTNEIQKALGNVPIDRDRSYDHRRVHSTLNTSPRFHQDFGRGFWNLSAQERERLPLLGRWAKHGDRDKFEDHCEAVGTAFMEARVGLDMSSATVVQIPEVRDALDIIGNHLLGMKALHNAEDRFAMFELGDVDVHFAAPVEFYRACAGLYSVCPARLSRGEVVSAQKFVTDSRLAESA